MKGAVVRGTLAAAVLSLPAPAQAGGLPRQAPGQPGQGLSMAFGAPVLVEAGRDYAGLACVGDFDVDGTNDVAFAGGFVLESNGPISITLLGRSYHARTSEAVGNPSANPLVTFPYARSADLDRDGFPDLVAIGQHGGIAVVRPLGAAQVDATLPRYRATHLAPAALDPMRWSALRVIPRVFLLEDVTGDGCVDLIFSGDFEDLVGRAGVTGLLLFPGDGLGGFRDPVTLVPKRVLGASVADLDGNRLPDVAAVDDESRLHWLLQRKRGQLDGFSLQVTELTHPEKVLLVDLDGDRRRDYVVVQGLEGSTIELALLINRGDGNVTSRTRRSVSVDGVVSVADGDLDNDGRRDLVLLQPDTGNGMTLYVLRGDGRGGFDPPHPVDVPFTLARELTQKSHDNLQLVDADADGALDLVIAPARTGSRQDVGAVIVPNLGPRRPEVIRLGTATPAASGVEPAIAIAGPVRLGNERLEVLLSRAPGTVPAFLFLSHKRLDVVLYGLQFKVFPFFSGVTVTADTGSLGGVARLRLAVPDDPGLIGQSLFLQWVMPAPGVANVLGIARSEAVELVVADRR